MMISKYTWLVMGALWGAFAVVLVHAFSDLSIPSWVGALIPTVCAVVGGFIAPSGGVHAQARKAVAE